MIHYQIDLVIRALPRRQQLTNPQLRSCAVEERPWILLRRMRHRLGERALLRGLLPVSVLIVGLGELRVQRSERRARREVAAPRRAPERSLQPANPLRLVFLEPS